MLARLYGWTPDIVRGLTPYQQYMYLQVGEVEQREAGQKYFATWADYEKWKLTKV